MRFVLGSDDFRQIRTDRAERDAETDRINTRNRARLDEQRGSTAPVVPTGQQRGLTINQVGPTAAEQEALQRQQAIVGGPSQPPGLRSADETAPAPAGLKTPFVTNVGISGGVDIPQVDPNDPYPVQIYNRAGAYINANQQLRDLREQIIPTSTYPRRTAGSNLNPWNLFSTGVNEVRRGLQYYLFAGKDKRESMELQEKMHDWYGGDLGMGITGNYGEGTKLLYANPKLFAEAKIDPVAFYKKHSQQTAGPAPATAPVAPVPTTAAPTATAPTAHDAIKYLESRNGTNIPKWAKGKTSSGVYGATDGTATGHGIQGVYVAKLKGLTPGSPEFNAEKDKAAAAVLDYYIGQYPNDPARVAMSYRFGTSAGLPKNWDGSDAGIRARAKRVKGAKPVDPDEAVRYVQTYVQRQSGGAAPVTVASVTPTQVAATALTEKDIQNNRANPLPSITRPVVEKGGSMADQLAKKKPDKIKEPPFNMPFNLRAQEITTLLQAREGLKRQAFITGGSPASAAYIEARAALGMNKAAIENMTQTQALNMMQNWNDPRMMNELLNTQFPGRGIRISPNSDGTFRVEADGKIIGARVSKVKLISGMRRTNSTQLHAALKAAKAKQIARRDEAIWKFKQAMTEKQWDHFTKLLVKDKENEGKYKLDGEGRLWSHRGGKRVLLGEAPRPSPDREGTTVVPTETPVEEINSAGLFTNVNTSGVTPALAGHFTSSFGG
jgi:hypothetical protein